MKTWLLVDPGYKRRKLDIYIKKTQRVQPQEYMDKTLAMKRVKKEKINIDGQRNITGERDREGGRRRERKWLVNNYISLISRSPQ